MNIVEFRKQNPQYDDMSDYDLGTALHSKFYSDIPRENFNAGFIAPTLPEPEVDVYGGIDPEGVMAEKAEEQKALEFIGGLTEKQMVGPTEGKVGFEEDIEMPTEEPVHKKIADYRGREVFGDQYGKWYVKKEKDFIELPEKAKEEIESELGGVVPDPWTDPTLVASGAAGMAGKLAAKLGAKEAARRAATAAVVTGAAELPIGVATEMVAEKRPELALPFNMALGLLSGATVENVIEKAVRRRFTKAVPKAVVKTRINEVTEALQKEDYSKPVVKEIAKELNVKLKETPIEKVVEKPEVKPEAPKKVEPIAEAKPEVKVAVEPKKPIKAKPVVPREAKPYTVGSHVKVGKSPQVNTIIKELPSTKEEKALGERFFEVKNEKTGKVSTVSFEDIKPIKLKEVKPEPTVPVTEKAKLKLKEQKGEVIKLLKVIKSLCVTT
jgi:hypothetical protein